MAGDGIDSRKEPVVVFVVVVLLNDYAVKLLFKYCYLYI